MFKNGLYNFIGAAFRLTVGILTIPILIRIIGIEEYGLWTIVSTVITIAALAEAGLSVSTTFFLSRDLANKDSTSISQTLTVSFCCMLFLATFAGIVLWTSSEYIIILFPKLSVAEQQTAISGFQIGAFVIWVKLLQRIFVGVEHAFQRYELFNLINTVQVFSVNTGMLWVAYKGGKTLEIMSWQLIVSILILAVHLITFIILIKGINTSFCWNWHKCWEIIKYCFMSWLVSIGSAMFSQVDKLIVGSILGTNNLGIYAAITNITSQINTLSSLSVQPMMPHLSKLLVSEVNNISIKKLVLQAFYINLFVAIGLGTGSMGISPFLLELILPNIDSLVYTYLFYIAIAIYTMYSMNAVGYYLLFGTDNVATCFKIQLISGLFSLGLILLGAKMWNLPGAILGNLGYLGVFALTYEGMKIVNLSSKEWLNFLIFMASYFLIVSIIIIFIPKSLIFRSTFIAIQSIILLIWFTQKYRSTGEYINLSS